VRRSLGMKSGGWVGSGGSERRGSSGMRRRLRNSSGSVVGTGRTFLSTRLYLRTRVAGLIGGGGRNKCCMRDCMSEEGGGKGGSWTEITLTAGACPVQGWVGR